jgi:hypothetical protein
MNSRNFDEIGRKPFNRVITIIIVYSFWVAFLQSSPAGIWLTELEDEKYEILYSKLYGTVTIMAGSEVVEVGTLKGSVLTIGEGDSQQIGMWDTNKIYWVTKSGSCGVWVRELTLI